MGRLTNLNPLAPIVDADIPGSIARDTETAAAINAHKLETDPHLQYANQARGDERYGVIKKLLFSGTVPTAQGVNASILHGLNYDRIVSLSGSITHPGGLVVSECSFTPGYQFTVTANSTHLFLGTTPGNSYNILSRPFKIVVHYYVN